MAITNFTEDGNQKTYKELFCSAQFTEELHNQLICFLVVSIFLSVTASLGNTLILAALQKESSLHPPSKLLYRTLSTTDLCVGIIAEPLVAAYMVSVLSEQWSVCRYLYAVALAVGYSLASVSLFTLTAISVDRLLALLLGLSYRQVVTLKRTYLILTAIWVVSIAATSMHFWNQLLATWCARVVTLLCIVISTVSYAKIFLTLRHHQIQVQNNIHQEQPSQAIPLNIARYRKAVSSALWVQMVLVVCYLPHAVVRVLSIQREPSSSIFIANVLTVILVFLNSSLNPILYCWKIKEVREAVKDIIRHPWCSSGQL